MAKATQKLYAYVDESGQDTQGQFFVVSVLVVADEREALRKELETIEQQSKKGRVKWHKARHAFRLAYIEAISQMRKPPPAIFFKIFDQTTKYQELTAYVTAKAVLRKARRDYQVTVFVDGLQRGEIPQFRQGLRDLNIKTRKIRGVRKEENDAYIRLVDAICGLVRDATEGGQWASDMVTQMQQAEILVEL